MRRLPRRLLRPATSALRPPATAALRAPAAAHGGIPATPALHPAAASAAPSSSLADLSRGFTPLKPKPLESIIDVERAKGLSPEHLVTA
ncbi:hypothetical protein SETIT_1G141200v2 [Setaria italica]|uniref:Uncharacterized protein n=1 Tax=Setaria italica TaxID=4555 RepID=A0A368PK45_SETIT|nr:hypothetical protein SETIT_1G141200v2 [Setaria italica]